MGTRGLGGRVDMGVSGCGHGVPGRGGGCLMEVEGRVVGLGGGCVGRGRVGCVFG